MSIRSADALGFLSRGRRPADVLGFFFRGAPRKNPPSGRVRIFFRGAKNKLQFIFGATDLLCISPLSGSPDLFFAAPAASGRVRIFFSRDRRPADVLGFSFRGAPRPADVLGLSFAAAAWKRPDLLWFPLCRVVSIRSADVLGFCFRGAGGQRTC